jgi:small ligand-binding sensory domain FIST
MRWASTLSTLPDATAAFGAAADALEEELPAVAADLLVAFVSPHHGSRCAELTDLAARRFPRALLAGCTASGVIGGAHEAESGAALSLTAAALPGVDLTAFSAEPGGAAPGWRERLRLPPEARPSFILLADPFSSDAGELVRALDAAYPGAPKVGGLASGGRRPLENRLLLGERVHRGGAVGVVLYGDVAVDTLVAQGCRRIGKPMLVTRCEGSVLEELDGAPPLQAIAELFRALDARDRELLHHSLFLGLEVRPEAVEHAPGELLVRNILGVDEGSGALAIGAELRPMTVAQFVLRDPHAAEEELRRMLVHDRRAAGRAAGALLFSCVGRGEGLFGAPDHDTSLFEEQLGPAPLGGFFCNGEIGPVGGATFLHGYTSAFAIFREWRGAPAG